MPLMGRITSDKAATLGPKVTMKSVYDNVLGRKSL